MVQRQGHSERRQHRQQRDEHRHRGWQRLPPVSRVQRSRRRRQQRAAPHRRIHRQQRLRPQRERQNVGAEPEHPVNRLHLHSPDHRLHAYPYGLEANPRHTIRACAPLEPVHPVLHARRKRRRSQNEGRPELGEPQRVPAQQERPIHKPAQEHRGLRHGGQDLPAPLLHRRAGVNQRTEQHPVQRTSGGRRPRTRVLGLAIRQNEQETVDNRHHNLQRNRLLHANHCNRLPGPHRPAVLHRIHGGDRSNPERTVRQRR